MIHIDPLSVLEGVLTLVVSVTGNGDKDLSVCHGRHGHGPSLALKNGPTLRGRHCTEHVGEIGDVKIILFQIISY